MITSRLCCCVASVSTRCSVNSFLSRRDQNQHRFIISLWMFFCFVFFTCFWIECEMKTRHFLLSVFFSLFKKSGFVTLRSSMCRGSSAGTRHWDCKAIFFFLFGQGAPKHPPLCLISCAISKYMNHILLYKARGTTWSLLIVLSVVFLRVFQLYFYFCTTSLSKVSDTGYY